MAISNERMVQLRDSSADWSGAAFIPLDGEWLLELVADGSYRAKIGNGIDTFAQLPYFTGYTENDIETIIDNHLVIYGVDVSTGVPDAGKFVRLNSQGLIDDSMLDPDLANLVGYTARYLGHINARDDSVDTALGPGFTFQTGDFFINTRGAAGGSDLYDASWPLIGGTACYDVDHCIYSSASGGFEIANSVRGQALYAPAP